jgi:hypothetical protein
MASHLHQPTAQVHRAERNLRHGVGRAPEGCQMSDLLIDLQISEIDLYAHDGTYVGVVHHEVDEKANDFVIDLAETCFTLESLKEIVTKFEEAVKLMEIKVK